MGNSTKSLAVIVGVHLPKVSDQDFHGSLKELTRLVTTLGYEVIGEVTQKRNSDQTATLLGEGKLKELALWTGGTGKVSSVVEVKLSKAAQRWADEKSASLEELEDTTVSDVGEDSNQTQLVSEDLQGKAQIVIVDTDLSPSQIRNLESASGVKVLDRTGVIIEIFSRHAKTRAAKLQVEVARLTYVAPRLRETGGGEDRGGGGVGGKGAGESSLELDKRKIRDRIKELKAEIAAIGNEHQVRRARREKEKTVALVGYTNAGKSSLMRALTGSEVLVQDKLFATLDTTIRPLIPESVPRILVSDTVGFIKKLPHDLVASFKSTLDEALNASLLLFVVDASDDSFRSQLEVTQKVLAEVGATDVPSLFVLNKQDQLDSAQMQSLMKEFPDAIFISTRNPEDIKKLREKVLTYFQENFIEEDLFIPYTAKGVIGEIRSRLVVVSESYTEQGVNFRVKGSEENIAKVKTKVNFI
ncbi:MAG: GTPase HflX [Bdellovibrionaceae bacterium]|nr:GTPase HflX [Pseudobdellovibrionaceae bacterium]NUM57298.1 GTPase HflX [Pseudobdellovibrionaceae bacterium]